MFYAILVHHRQTEPRAYVVTDFGDLDYCRTVRNDDGTFVKLSKARYTAGASEATELVTATGQREPSTILQLTER